MPIAVIALDFDPLLRVGGIAIRLETLAVAGSILLALVVAAILAGRMPAEVDRDPVASRPVAAGQSAPWPLPRPRLRRDDLLYIVIATIPGAVAGGRIVYGLAHADYFGANPLALFDPALGSADLVGAIAGGALTGAVVVGLVDGSIGRWLHVATIPVLLLLALGKAAAALGGDGQGAPSDVAWATAYGGPGPWASLVPAVPSHPSQLYEAAAALVVLLVVLTTFSLSTGAVRGGRFFFVALAAWGIARAVVATTWRDPAILGPLNAGQLIAAAFAVACLGLAAVVPRSRRMRSAAPSPEPAWPDPATRPPF